ncbi:MAG: WYL domain-containing protein [Lachnospiraceae bacterium]|nr:WYL domain-containing protein [Lachnospiraceae bacterium]
MNKALIDPVYRMTQYLYLMSAVTEEDAEDGGGASISQIREKLDLPLELIRDDFVRLFRKGLIEPFDWEEAEEEMDVLLKRGDADDVRMSGIPQNDKYKLPLTGAEYASYRLLHKEAAGKTEPVLQIKDSFRSSNASHLLTHLQLVTEAINGKRYLELKMREGVQHRIRPYKIFYNALDNDYAIVTIEDTKPKLYPLAFIESIRITEKWSRTAGMKKNDTRIDSKLHRLWGTEYKEDKIHVRVRFYDEANVHAKVRRDCANRKYASLSETEGCLLFEDDVYGYDAFKSWVLGFGFSAIVEKPAKLRRDIINEMQRRLEKNG